MATPPDFVAGQVLTAAQMNKIGLWLVKTQTTGATGITSLDITSCFNADFRHYFVNITGLGNGVLAGHQLQLLSGSTPATTSYFWAGTSMASNSSTVTGENVNNTNYMGLGEQSTSATTFAITLFVQNPFLAVPTRFQAGHSIMNATPISINWMRNGMHNVSSSYDGFRFLSSNTQTFNTMNVSVYGYQEA